MVTLQKLANELKVTQIDEIVGGYYQQGDVEAIDMEEKWLWTITTVNGTSGGTGWTFTTDEATIKGQFDPITGAEEIGYLN